MAGIHPLCLSIPQNGMKETDAGVRAFSIAALVAEGNTKILDSKCVDVSYPTFYDTFEALL